GWHALHRAYLPVRGVDGTGRLFRRGPRQQRLSGRDASRRLRGAALPGPPAGADAALSASLPGHPAALHRADADAGPGAAAAAPAGPAAGPLICGLCPGAAAGLQPDNLDRRRLVLQPAGLATSVLYRLP